MSDERFFVVAHAVAAAFVFALFAFVLSFCEKGAG